MDVVFSGLRYPGDKLLIVLQLLIIFFGCARGGRGSVDPKEVRELFLDDFNILEERPATREKMLYILERRHKPR